MRASCCDCWGGLSGEEGREARGCRVQLLRQGTSRTHAPPDLALRPPPGSPLTTAGNLGQGLAWGVLVGVPSRRPGTKYHKYLQTLVGFAPPAVRCWPTWAALATAPGVFAGGVSQRPHSTQPWFELGTSGRYRPSEDPPEAQRPVGNQHTKGPSYIPHTSRPPHPPSLRRLSSLPFPFLFTSSPFQSPVCAHPPPCPVPLCAFAPSTGRVT